MNRHLIDGWRIAGSNDQNLFSSIIIKLELQSKHIANNPDLYPRDRYIFGIDTFLQPAIINRA
jgi:hypothetical protein